jgi:hypothetical protein
MKRGNTICITICALLALLAAILACNTSNMRAKDMPVWTCPTDVLPPTLTMEPGWEFLTPPPPTYTPWPTQTPFTLMSDFPLGKHVKIGGVGGIGLGIWVWLDNVVVSGPFEYPDRETGEIALRWVAQWDVNVENASLTSQYEVYPFAQFYVFEVIEADGETHTTGAWGISAEAHDQIGIPRLDVTTANNVLNPHTIHTYTVAAYIPTSEVWRLGYVLDPLDNVKVDEMVAHNTLGSNVGIWINQHDDTCSGEITPEADGTGTPPGTGEQLLTGHPVSIPNIIRGFGCTDFYTGDTSNTACPASQPWFHNGIDYAVTQGSNAVNVIDSSVATIEHAGENPTGPDCSDMAGSQAPHFGYGNYVKATGTVNDHGLQVWWAHLSAFVAHEGDVVMRGSVVGHTGSTGCSTGPHLHFAVKVDGVFVDPLTIMP